MNASEYIISELEIFIKKFSKVRIRYEYDKMSCSHFVEVVPNEIYHLDENYIKWESEMFDKFIEHYPYENICFISDDDLVGIGNTEWTICGKNYIQISTIKENITFDTISVLIQQTTVKDMINTTIYNKNTCNSVQQMDVQIYQNTTYLLAA